MSNQDYVRAQKAHDQAIATGCFRYAKPGDFLEVAELIIRRSEFIMTEEDIDTLTQTLAEAAESWFGDTKHLLSKYATREAK